ncbi:MAG: pilin [Patescibacteria group bacterium]
MKKIIFLIISFSPLIVLAQSGYTLLEPSVIGMDGVVKISLLDYLQKAFNILITVGVIFAIVSVIYGGAMYILSGIPGQINKGKGIMKNAFVGLALILSSWLILHTINPNLTTLSLDLESSGSGGVAGATNPDPTGISPPGSGTNNNPSGGAVVGQSGLSHQEVMGKLKPGIEIKPGVDMAGVQQSTIDGINKVKTDCPDCQIIITSATGDVHSTLGPYSHANGYKLDIRRTDSKLNSYIADNFSRTGTVGGYPQYIGRGSNSNVVILDEGDHWDWQFKP